MSTIKLLSKTLGQKIGLSPYITDTFKFINKKGEQNIYRVLRDAQNRIVETSLTNETARTYKKCRFNYKNYTFQNGETVPYTRMSVENPDGSWSREIISTVKDGEKLDVTKRKLSFTPMENGNISENSFIGRFSRNKKPTGVFTNIERDKSGEILSKKVYIQKADGKRAKIIPDLFYHTAAYDDITFKGEVIKLLESELGVKGYGVKVKPAHYGYSKKGSNTYARYIPKTKTVHINVDVPIVNTRKEFVSQVAHELTHAWQHKEVELLEQGVLTGGRKEAAKIYKNEFDNYIKPSKTDETQYLAYLKQVVETKAREMEKFVGYYYNRNMKNIYNSYAQGIIPPQIGITAPLPTGVVKNFDIRN